MTRERRLVVALAMLLASAAAREAAGQTPAPPAGKVTLLQPNPATASARRYLMRIREELIAGGFEVTLAEFGVGVDPLWVIDAGNQPDGTLATVALVGDPDAGASELWIVDRVAPTRAAVRRIRVPSSEVGRGDEVAAIRAVEFLRASAAELAARQPAGARPATVVAPARPAPPAVPPGASAPAAAGERLSLAVGISRLDSLGGGPGAALLPTVRLRVSLSALLGARLTVAGLGSRPRVVDPLGSATVGQDLALVEISALSKPRKRFRFGASAGAGALTVGVDGEGAWPYEGRDGRRWAALISAAVGASVALTSRLAASLELGAMLANPYPTVRFSESESARIGRPSLLASITLVSTL